MITAQQLSNSGKNLVTRKTLWHVIVLNAVNKNLLRLIETQADPAREN